MRPNRRTVLSGLGASALLGGLGGPLIRSARASTLGTYSLSGGPYKVLEIFLSGALSHQETIWMTDEDGPGWLDLDDPASWGAVPHGSPVELGVDAGGMPVWLGGMCAPLTTGTWLDATRVVALGHGLPAHLAAIPFALGGHTLGRPARSGLGAAIARRADEVEGISTPVSFVLHGGSRRVARYALATGRHDSAYRPIELALGSKGNRVVAQLVARGEESWREGLLGVYGARYARRLHRSDLPMIRVRSLAFADHDAARRQLGEAGNWAADLADITGTDPSDPSGSGLLDYTDMTWATAVDAAQREGGYITRAIGLARGLLAGSGDLEARHVCVIDDGVGQAHNYDSHAAQHSTMSDAFQRQAGQLWWVLAALADAYGDDPPSDTLIVIHTEFGRAQVHATGTEHHTAGYAAMLIGGPVVQGVGGVMTDLVTADEDHGQPGPADLHAATLCAAGVDPAHEDCFDGYGAGKLAFADDAGLLGYMLGV